MPSGSWRECNPLDDRPSSHFGAGSPSLARPEQGDGLVDEGGADADHVLAAHGRGVAGELACHSDVRDGSV